MLKKVISTLLSILILVMAIPIEPITYAIGTEIEKIQTIAATETKVGVSTIDLTGLAIGTDANHTHIYEKKFDTTKHWEECWICHYKINVNNHNIKISGTAGCLESLGKQKQYCSDGCGYSVELSKTPHTSTSNWFVQGDRAKHAKRCTVCGVETESELCKDSQGRTLGCGTGISGVCATCGDYKNGAEQSYLSFSI